MLRQVNNERGMAFILVVWVLVLLFAIGTQFAYSMRTEVNTTRNYKEDTEAYYLAKAGINLAMAEILKKAHYHSWTKEKGFIAGTPPPPADGQEVPDEETELEAVVREDLALGSGTVSYSIRDENGKININSATRETLVKVLEQAGMDTGSDRDAIADSILDWIDKDDNHRLNGAENEYYKSQFPPYKAKNGPMDTLDELMMVKGVTEEMFYGSPDFVEGEENEEGVFPGLNHFFTVQAVPFFNPNTASPEVLRVVYPEANVSEILSNKEGKGYHSLTLSSHFRIRAVGKINNSQTEHTIEAVIEKSGNDDKSMLVVRFWKDNQLGS